MRKVVFITGMHRSGTSLAARVVNLLGVDLGPPARHIQADEANPRGHWEALPLVDINRDLLEAMGGSWDRPPALAPGWEHETGLDPLRDRARDWLDALFPGKQRPIGFKDPRLCLTLPFWRTVVEVDTVVLCLREPAALADSLMKRNELDREHSAALWIEYVCASWANTTVDDRVLVDYWDLVDEPLAAARMLARTIALGEPAPEVEERIVAFAEPSLHRSVSDDRDPGPLMELARSLWESLTLATGPPGSLDRLLADARTRVEPGALVERERATAPAATASPSSSPP